MLDFCLILEYIKVLKINANVVALISNSSYPSYGYAVQNIFEKNMLPEIAFRKGKQFSNDNIIIENMMVIGDYNPNNHYIVINCSNDISYEQQLHTLVHEYIHVLQWEFEFKDLNIPKNKTHNSFIWNRYCEFFGLEMENPDQTKIIKGGRTDRLIKKILT